LGTLQYTTTRPLHALAEATYEREGRIVAAALFGFLQWTVPIEGVISKTVPMVAHRVAGTVQAGQA